MAPRKSTVFRQDTSVTNLHEYSVGHNENHICSFFESANLTHTFTLRRENKAYTRYQASWIHDGRASNYALKLGKWPQDSRATGRRFHHAPANWVIPSSWQYCSLVTYYFCVRHSLSSRASAFKARTADSPHIVRSTYTASC